jgi:hypothetical protein
VDARTQGGLLSPDLLAPAERKITLAVAGEVRTYTVVDPSAPGGERTRVAGVLMSSRRQPTPDEIKRINQSLETVARGMDQKPAAAAAASAATAAVSAAAEPDA